MTVVAEITREAADAAAPESGTVLYVPLNKLKKSPRNARKTPHSEAAIAALAASIAVKGVLQPPVVEPELDGGGQPTGAYFVTIGEGRRQALLLRAKRKEIKKSFPVRCILDTENDAHEISLDENVNRSDMHPADEFEAFREQAERRGFGPEEIAARFGTTAHVVRQRLRLANVSPKLIQTYRDGGMSLDQLMAFAVTDDHARQEQVWESLQTAYNKEPSLIRRYLTQNHATARDKRVVFVGAEAYEQAGGVIARDLFHDDGGGYFTDVALLDRLVAEKLDAIAEEVRAEGWKWVQAVPEFAYGLAIGLRRFYPQPVPRPAEEQVRLEALEAEYAEKAAAFEALTEESEESEALAVRLGALEEELAAFDEQAEAYDPEQVAYGGAFVSLDSYGQLKVERGFVRPEDEPQPEPETEISEDETAEDGGVERVTFTVGGAEPGEIEEEPEGFAPLSDKLLTELTAARTLALREAVASDTHIAMIAVTHALALRAFYSQQSYDPDTCLEIEAKSAGVTNHAPGLADTASAKFLDATHEAWAKQMPQDSRDLWGFVSELDGDSRSALFAYCASRTVNAVRQYGLRARALAHADKLAQSVALDMSGDWTPTVDNYLGRVTKPRILEAVREGVGADAAERIADWKKQAMAAEAEALLAGKGWLPAVLRTPGIEPAAIAGEAEAPAEAEAPEAEPVAIAAE